MESKSKSFDAINIMEGNKATWANKFHHEWINSESGKQFKKELKESDVLLAKKLEEVERKLNVCRAKLALQKNGERIYMAVDKLEKDFTSAVKDLDEFTKALAVVKKLDHAQEAKETDVQNAKSKKGFWSKFWSNFCCGKCCGKSK